MYRHADDVDIGPLGFPIALHGLGIVPAAAARTGGGAQVFPTTDAMAATAAPRATPAAAAAVNMDAVKYSPDPAIAKLAARVGDLEFFGAISAVDRTRVNDLLLAGRKGDAEVIISEKETKLQNRKSNTIFSKVDSALPDGFKLGESAIGGVPNFVLYAGAGLFGVLILRSALKKR